MSPEYLLTNVALTLSSRNLAAAAATLGDSAAPTAQPAPLAALQPGRGAIVTGYAPNGPAATLRRLVDLGFGIGEHVDVVRRAPMGDPIVYRLAGYEVALRRTESRLIIVRDA